MSLTMNPAGRNGQKRPSLNEQIQRLDKILDGLADGLNEAVAAAVKSAVETAVQQTVQAVLSEVLANPAVLARLQPTPIKEEAKTPTPRDRIGGILGRIRVGMVAARNACVAGVNRVRSFLTAFGSRMMAAALAGCARVRSLRCFARQIITALGVGVMIGLAAWCFGPLVVTALTVLGAAVSVVAVRMAFVLRRITDGIVDLSQGRLS